MAKAAKTIEPAEAALALERATDEAVKACDGDAWAAVRALLVANAALEEEIARLSARVKRLRKEAAEADWNKDHERADRLRRKADRIGAHGET